MRDKRVSGEDAVHETSECPDYRNRILAFAYSLKDAVGITVKGIPIRANELILAVSVLLDLRKRRAGRPDRKETVLWLLLLINLIYTLCQTWINGTDIDRSFFFKYLARNLFYVGIFGLYAIGTRRFTSADILFLCRMILVVNVLFGVILYTTGYRFDLGTAININQNKFQVINISGRKFPRFFGTASEAGYLGPFLMMPLYFFFNGYVKQKKYKIELAAVFIIIALTVSAFVYGLSLLICFTVLIRTGEIKKVLVAILVIVGALLLLILAYYTIPLAKQIGDTYFVSKINTLLGNGDMFDYSGYDRNYHFSNCIRMFMEQPIEKKLFGIGTGGYSAFAKDNVFTLYNEVFYPPEEAYNIYLSTLLDRGIVGVMNLFLIFFLISKFRVKQDDVSFAIYMGIVAQVIHWMITGNMWVCYFWMEVMYLIGYRRNVKGGQLCLKNRE